MEWTCFDALDPPLYLSSAELPQPNGVQDIRKSRRILKKLGIKRIVNMSSDSPAKKAHLDFYKKMGIELVSHPIDDMGGFVKNDILDVIVGNYRSFVNAGSNRKCDGAVLVHCTLGINRSAFAAGAILWSQLGGKKWKDPEEMIVWMRECQKRDRRFGSLLENGWMKASLIRWCYQRDDGLECGRERKRKRYS